MNYVVYCDESRHTGGPNCRFAVIGGVWIPQEHRDEINRNLRNLKRENGIGSELKWSRVSNKMLDNYKKVSDFFWNDDRINFRAIVVDQKSVSYSLFHDGDRELGFYKFYYEMLEKWIIPGNDYNILLDFKNNSESSRLVELKKVLDNYSKSREIKVTNLTSIDSSRSCIAQLCDVLTGAVAADTNGTLADTPKAELIKHMSRCRQVSPLSAPSGSPTFSKFNIFRIALDSRGFDQ